MNIQLKDVDNVVFNGIDVSAVKFNDVLVWRKWETIEYTGAVPVEIYAAGEPLIELLISGNMNQSGTPAPDNPVMPNGTGERTGNLFDRNFSQFDNTGGTGTTYAYFALTEQCTLTAVPKDDITISDAYYLGLSGDGGDASNGVLWAIAPGRTYQKGVPISITNRSMLFCSIYPKVAKTLNWILEHFDIMLNTGRDASPYEPYGYKIPISSAGQITPVYLGEVETTRRIEKLILDGTENITLFSMATGNLFRISLPVDRIQDVFYGNGFCSHYRAVLYSAERVNGTISGSGSAGLQSTVDIVDDYLTVADFKAYLAQQYASGTPVTVWYVLATEETGIVNEPLRKIGTYTDSLSLPAGVSIPTVEGSNVVDVETTPKPSEVYIKYKGKTT